MKDHAIERRKRKNKKETTMENPKISDALRRQRAIEDEAIEKGPAGDALRAQLKIQREQEDADTASLSVTNGAKK